MTEGFKEYTSLTLQFKNHWRGERKIVYVCRRMRCRYTPTYGNSGRKQISTVHILPVIKALVKSVTDRHNVSCMRAVSSEGALLRTFRVILKSLPHALCHIEGLHNDVTRPMLRHGRNRPIKHKTKTKEFYNRVSAQIWGISVVITDIPAWEFEFLPKNSSICAFGSGFNTQANHDKSALIAMGQWLVTLISLNPESSV